MILLFFGASVSLVSEKEKPAVWNTNNQKVVMVQDSGFDFPVANVAETTVGALLASQDLTLQEGDMVFPNEEAQLFSGTIIHIARAHPMTISVDGSERTLLTQALSVGQALDESDIVLDEDDIVKPDRETFAKSGIKVVITRVEIEEQSTDKPIAFGTQTVEDLKLSWRKTVVTQKGENGIERLTYKVSKHDGKEVNRKLLKRETIKEPVTQIVIQGTDVRLGKSHTGAASWYAWTGTMAAANPWLPKGSYVKVTNLENGKSVIVVINDRGPFVPGRIIDLDKVAFAKIASVGAGVINVKMEEITN
ncbi:MAG TPA: G5 domain-containing protein [Patescibacteria group bacterium]|nr:G5 domain-containing protein [Patescibacteria group bacterium]